MHSLVHSVNLNNNSFPLVEKGNDLIKHNPDYNIPSSSCIVVQFLHGVWGFENVNLYATYLENENHRLFRHENIFLHPLDNVHSQILLYTIAVKHKQYFPGGPILAPHYSPLALRYHKGETIAGLDIKCNYEHCESRKQKVKFHRVSNYDIELKFPNIFGSMYSVSNVVEYPKGTDRRENVFPSYNFNPDNHLNVDRDMFIVEMSTLENNRLPCSELWVSQKSWLSSTVFNIDCDKSIKEISAWSYLTEHLIKKICRVHRKEFSLKAGTLHYILWPPSTTKRDMSYIWTLKILIEAKKKLRGKFLGVLVARTEAKPGICDQRFQSGLFISSAVYVDIKFGLLENQGERVGHHTCLNMYTIYIIDVESVNRRQEVEIGYQLFQYNDVTLQLFEKSDNMGNNSNISYKWSHIKYHSNNNSVKLMNMYTEKYSWLRALAKCKQQEMTLPHFKDRKSTLEFVARIAYNYIYPPLVFFIGLIRKVIYHRRLKV